MADRPKACRTEGLHEPVRVCPAVECEAEAVRLEHTVHLGECRLQPGIIVVVWYHAAITRLIACNIWRVGEDEIGASGVELGQDVEAIAADDGVAVRSHI